MTTTQPQPETDPSIVPLTTSWTPEQKAIVDAMVMDLANYCSMRINSRAGDIAALDKRPQQVPNAMLEDLIHELQTRV